MQDFRAASLKSDTLQRVVSLEDILSQECGEPIILVAYTASTHDRATAASESVKTGGDLTSIIPLD